MFIYLFYLFIYLFILQHIIMKSSIPEKEKKKMEDNIIKDVRIFFRLKKEIDNTTIKDARNRQHYS